MFNGDFAAAKKIVSGKHTIGVLKITKFFFVTCPCGEERTAYCISCVECSGCGLNYVVGSPWKEWVDISGQRREIVALAGCCPRCHRKNMSRFSTMSKCGSCGGEANTTCLPDQISLIRPMNPIQVVWTAHPRKKVINLLWGLTDITVLRCEAKFME